LVFGIRCRTARRSATLRTVLRCAVDTDRVGSGDNLRQTDGRTDGQIRRRRSVQALIVFVMRHVSHILHHRRAHRTVTRTFNLLPRTPAPRKSPSTTSISMHLSFTKIGSTNMQYYCMKIKYKGKQVTINILHDDESAYLADYTAIQRVSLNKFVFAHGHSVSNVTGSTHFSTLRGDFRSIDI